MQKNHNANESDGKLRLTRPFIPPSALHCPVTAKIKLDGEVVAKSGVHNHGPELGGHGFVIRHCRQRWLDYMRAHPRSDPMDVVLHHRRDLQDEAASKIKPSSQIRTAQRHATSVKPKTVHSLHELDRVIFTQPIDRYMFTRNGTRLLSFHLPNHNSTFISTLRLVELVPSATMIHADATYKVVPQNLCSQMFTIHCNWNGFVSISGS